MVDKLNYKYLYQKRDVYYFSKQIPKDIRSHYLKDRMIICLRTKCPRDATKLRDSILSMRGRLQIINCPSEMIDQIGGWSNNQTIHLYGLGHPLSKLSKYMLKLLNN